MATLRPFGIGSNRVDTVIDPLMLLAAAKWGESMRYLFMLVPLTMLPVTAQAGAVHAATAEPIGTCAALMTTYDGASKDMAGNFATPSETIVLHEQPSVRWRMPTRWRRQRSPWI